LVSEQLPLTCLYAEYSGDEIFTAKIQDLSKKYKFIRRTRPDGNCFFRAFAYSYLEYLISNTSAYQEFKKLAEESKEKLVQLGFPSFTLEDFHETVCLAVQMQNEFPMLMPPFVCPVHGSHPAR